MVALVFLSKIVLVSLCLLKSRLYKVSEEGEGLTHEKLKTNITSVIRGIPKEKYENIFKGAYNRDVVYVKNKTRKRKLKNYKE
jgi:hypothetical protein